MNGISRSPYNPEITATSCMHKLPSFVAIVYLVAKDYPSTAKVLKAPSKHVLTNTSGLKKKRFKTGIHPCLMKPLNSMDPPKFPKKECRSEMVCLDRNTRTTELNLFLSPHSTGICRALCWVLCGIQGRTIYRFCPLSFYCLITVRGSQ